MSYSAGQFMDPHRMFQDLIQLQLEHEHLREQHGRLNRECIQRRRESTQLTAYKSQARDDVKKLREQCAVLETQNASLRQDLQNCKDDLFRLQPTNQIPDSIVSQHFESLNNAISDWVDDEVARFADEWEKHHGDEPPEIFHYGANDDWKTILDRYPNTGGEYIVRGTISSVLHTELFDPEVFLFGLLATEREFLRKVENEMSCSQPPKERSSIQSWKAETLSAVAASAEYGWKRANATHKLWVSLISDLAYIFPTIADSAPCQSRLYAKIVTPAVSLAVKIQTSGTLYFFKPCIRNAYLGQRYFVSRDHLVGMKVLDLETGKTLKADSMIGGNQYGAIGHLIVLLTPALWRQGESEKPIRLTQETIVAEPFHPIGRRSANTKQNSQRQTSDGEDPLA